MHALAHVHAHAHVHAQVPLFKRAMTFVFLMRYVFGYECQRQWHKFAVSDLKFNTRCFKRWIDKDPLIFAASEKHKAMPDTMDDAATLTRKRSSVSEFSSDSPMKRTFIVNDDSTDDED